MSVRQRKDKLLAPLTLAGLWILQSLAAEAIGVEPDGPVLLIDAAEELCGNGVCAG